MVPSVEGQQRPVMKEVPGIKALSIGAIIANVALFILMFVISYRVLHRWPSSDNAILLLIGAGLFTIVLLYPILLLRVQRRYQTYMPVTSVARRFSHIFRIVQLIYNILLAFVLFSSIFNLYRYAGPPQRTYIAFIQFGFLVLLLICVFLNLMIFVKGRALLKLVKKNYIDEVMATFD
jgi:hypothetical protein